MSKICYLMGKSSSGKDTIFKMLSEEMPELKQVVLYTTRPIRSGEKDGVEYFFVGDERLNEFREAGKLIELREYHTKHGIWKYFTADDGQIDLKNTDYLMIGTLESYEKMREYFGQDILLPIYVEVEDGLRLERALRREQMQEEPRYAEMCRRFLADAADFSEENLERAGVKVRFINTDISQCLQEIMLYLKENL